MSSPPEQPPALVSPPSSAPAGKYHIVKPLKLGGTAAIYLAIMRGENNFSREVVIKRPLPHLVAEPRSRHMFIDEAHIASRLSHPNICQVLDLVAREAELYIVLEYLRGVDLREIIKRCIRLGRPVPVEIAVWLAVEVAAGLDYAHHATTVDGRPLNLVHRDVSPKNIRVTFEGSVKVIDFGIARAEHRITQTSSGTIKGTLGYMSPEQILGDDIDLRSDIFAFGIVLFQMLTLNNPFDGTTLKERVRRLTQAPIPSVRQFNTALDEELASIVARCLDRSVEDRFPRLLSVQEALDRYLASLRVVSPRQQLISFLNEIFPSFDDVDADLKAALAEVSRISGPIDASLRLRFPDDPPTEPMSAPTPRTPAVPRPSASATHPTDKADSPDATRPDSTQQDSARPHRAEAAGRAGSTGPMRIGEDGSTFDKAATQPPTATSAAGGRPWSDPGTDDTRPLSGDNWRPTPAGPRPSPSARVWGGRLLLAFVAMMVAGTATVLLWPPAQVTTQALDENPRGVVPADLDEAAPTRLASVGSAEKAVARKAVSKAAKKKATPRRVRPSRPSAAGEDRARARLLFQTGVRLTREGRVDDALLLYKLAYAYSGRRPDPSIFLNLGLLHNREGNKANAKACLQGYLQRRPEAPQAGRVRLLVSSFEALPVVACVDQKAIKKALQAESRRGAQIRGWLDATLEARLR